MKIAFQNGMLGIAEPTADGVCGLVPDGALVVSNYTEHNGAAYLITSLGDLTKEGSDPLSYEMVREFFDEAGDGSYLWVLNAKPTTSAEGVTNLQTLANGACRTIAVVTPLDDSDVENEVEDLHDAAVGLTTSLFAPVLVVAGIEAPATLGDALDLTTLEYNRVAVVCGNEATGVTATDDVLKEAACVGLLLGRIAKNAVQVSVARVADGPIEAEELKFGTKSISNADSQILHGKGYVVPRTWVGKAGFFWSSDSLATGTTDDYGLIQRRRTIDKAYRVSYKALLEEVGAEIPVKADGTIPTSTAKSIEAMVETALERSMANLGNLGADPDDDSDNGIKVYVDPNQNVVATNTIIVSVKVKPYGYAYYIEANLSFYTAD